MAYSRTNWKDKVVSTPNKYKDQSNVSYTFTPDEGVVTEAGTPVNAGNMNKIDLTLFINNNIFACTGSANTYATTIAGITAIADLVGIPFAISLNIDASAASTLNVNGYGAHAILKPNGVGFANGKLNGIYTMIWNGTNFILQGSDSSGNAVPADLYIGKTASTDNGDIVGTRNRISCVEMGFNFPVASSTIAVSSLLSSANTINYGKSDALGNIYLLYTTYTSAQHLAKIDSQGRIIFDVAWTTSNYKFYIDVNNILFILDYSFNTIKKINPTTGAVTASVAVGSANGSAITGDEVGNIYVMAGSGECYVYKFTNALVANGYWLASGNLSMYRIFVANSQVYCIGNQHLEVRAVSDGTLIWSAYDVYPIGFRFKSDSDILVVNSSTNTISKIARNGTSFSTIWTCSTYKFWHVFSGELGDYFTATLTTAPPYIGGTISSSGITNTNPSRLATVNTSTIFELQYLNRGNLVIQYNNSILVQYSEFLKF